MSSPADTNEPIASPTSGSTVWWWQLLDAEGRVVEPERREEFPTRSDAESWVGETWADLAEDGVAAVTLHEGDRKVYGPMSLASE